MKKHYAYIVKWLDSASSKGWRHMNDNHSPVEITSVGWIVKQDKEYVAITTSISSSGSVMDTLSVPRSCIKKMTRLKQHVTKP